MHPVIFEGTPFFRTRGAFTFPPRASRQIVCAGAKAWFCLRKCFFMPSTLSPRARAKRPLLSPRARAKPEPRGLIHTRENLGDPPCHPERSRGVLRVALLLQRLFVLPNVGDTCAIRLRARFLRSLRSVGMTKRSSRKSRRDGACDFLRKKTTPRRIPPVTPSAVEESCALRFCYKVFLYCRM